MYILKLNAEIFSHFYSFATFIRCLRLCRSLAAERRLEEEHSIGLIVDVYVSVDTTVLFRHVSMSVKPRKKHTKCKIQNYSTEPLQSFVFLLIFPFTQGAIC